MDCNSGAFASIRFKVWQSTILGDYLFSSILFLGQFASYFGALLDPLLSLDPVSYTFFVTLVFTLSKPIGGILFGIAFYTLARNFRQNPALRNYLMISALGFVLLYVSNQASVLVVTPFPPFGAPTVAFMALASDTSSSLGFTLQR